ncbi:hypothetical protein CLV43_102455 [Umezawaea tangerina]|uniref:Uncharacterized protein n=1 Tax=Umezawaea tangerina TaxID=84725 RepID=A0A2T0TGU7_9PSEU|nr:hypothetical protein CLV43_102455 [Umezawaea tangerina]
MSNAALRVWGVAGVAAVLALWHGWGILITPERSFFWFMTAADVLVVVVAVWLGKQWPRYADVEEGGIVLLRQRIRFEAVTGIRLGDVSAKPFWLAFWLPTSLVVGLVVAVMPAGSFDREVLEIDTENGRARLRWRESTGHDQVVRALRTARPDLEPRYGLTGDSRARDFSPRMGVGGGLLAAGLALWVLVAGWSGIQLTDQSTVQKENSTAATVEALRTLTKKMTGYEALPGVRAEYVTWRCDRNNYLLGPSPDVVDLHLKIVGSGVSEQVADGVESRVRRNAGMGEGDYLKMVDLPRSGVAVDVPLVESLYVEVFTGCVGVGDVEELRGELEGMARALGVGR